MIKKWISLFLIFLLVFVPTGCGAKPEVDEESEDEVLADSETETEEIPEDSEAAEEETESVEILPGTVEGSVYENATLGYGCTIGEGWYFYSQEAIDEMNQLSLEHFTDEEISEQLASVTMFYDMMAQSEDGSAMMQVAVENVGELYGTAVSLDEYLEITVDNLEASLSAAGYTDCTFSTEQITFAGEEKTALLISAQLQDVAVYQQIVPMKYGKHVAIFAVASFYEDLTPNLLDLYYKLS